MQKYGLYIPPEVLDNRKLKAIEKLVFGHAENNQRTGNHGNRQINKRRIHQPGR